MLTESLFLWIQNRFHRTQQLKLTIFNKNQFVIARNFVKLNCLTNLPNKSNNVLPTTKI